MAQWINLYRNNIFVNLTRLPLLCEKSGAILLLLVGLTAAWQSGRLAVRRNKGRFEKFLLIAFYGVLQRYSVIVVLPMYFSHFLRVKHIVRHVVEGRKSGMPCFSCRSLLLSTTVLNDNCDDFFQEVLIMILLDLTM